MKHIAFAGGIALSSFIALPAMAELSAQDVWAQTKNWMSTGTEYPIKIGSEVQDGNTLTVSDIVWDITPDDEFSFIMTLPEILFIEQTDGSVVIDQADVATIHVVIGEPDDRLEIIAEIRQPGAIYTASGDKNNITYDFNAPLIEIVATELIGAKPGVNFDIVAKLHNIVSQSTVATTDIYNVITHFSTSGLDLRIGATDTTNDENLYFVANISDLSGGGDISAPIDMENMRPEEMLQNLAYALEYQMGKVGYTISGALEDMGPAITTFEITAEAESAKATTDFDKTGSGLTKHVDNLSMTATTSALPFPLNFTMEQASGDFRMPLSAQDPSEFRIGMGLINTSFNDAIWNMFDPGQILPRDPATIDFLITGSLRWLIDVMDPKEADIINAATPAELYSANLDRLNISAAGVQLTGGGGFTFDNTDLETFDGLPRPLGRADLKLTGRSGLLKNLAEMGILSQEDMFAASFMMNMFAQNVEGEDAITSSIEVNESGHLFANGQRLQ